MHTCLSSTEKFLVIARKTPKEIPNGRQRNNVTKLIELHNAPRTSILIPSTGPQNDLNTEPRKAT